MKRTHILKTVLMIGCCLSALSAAAAAQETYTGNIFQYGSRAYTGLRTGNFTLTINRTTSEDQAGMDLKTLQDRGQTALLDSIRNEDVGSFSINQGLSRTINAVRETQSGGLLHIYAIFQRWEQFNELRGGYRSLDYPFGYIELTIDPKTGKGTGQYFAAAKIRWKSDKSQVEVEDYATFPAKLVNVQSTVRRQ